MECLVFGFTLYIFLVYTFVVFLFFMQGMHTLFLCFRINHMSMSITLGSMMHTLRESGVRMVMIVQICDHFGQIRYRRSGHAEVRFCTVCVLRLGLSLALLFGWEGLEPAVQAIEILVVAIKPLLSRGILCFFWLPGLHCCA